MQDLRILPCLSGLRDKELSTISRLARIRNTGKDEVIFKESEPAEFFFALRKGTVKLYKTSEEGRELTVKIMRPGDYFCCAPLYSGGKHYVGANTVERSTLIVIPAKDFKEKLREEVGETGWKIIVSLCSKIRYLSGLVEDLTFKDVEARVVGALLRLADERHTDSNIVSLNLTHQDIASMTGTVREVVSRTISRLKTDGTILNGYGKGFKIDRYKLSRH